MSVYGDDKYNVGEEETLKPHINFYK